MPQSGESSKSKKSEVAKRVVVWIAGCPFYENRETVIDGIIRTGTRGILDQPSDSQEKALLRQQASRLAS